MPPTHPSLTRCPWGQSPAIYVDYHDQEWGVPVFDDRTLFEFLVLETFQAGLSWLTILRKREAFRAAFADFDPSRVARFGDHDITQLLQNAAIVRNRAKIEAAVINARRFLTAQDRYGSFAAFIWSFVDGKPVVNHWRDMTEVPAKTDLSTHISKTLRKDGWRFVGPTVIYSHMQATGMVNDHLVSCFRHKELSAI